MKSKMMLIPVMMMVLSAGSCAGAIEAGDFCDLAEPIVTDDERLAEIIVERDRDFGKGLNRHNGLVGNC